MPNLILFFKGIIIGLGKIIPGVSGSMLAFSLGVYEDAIKAIAYFRQNIKSNSIYLFKLGCGILLAILLFSRVVIFMLDKFYLLTIILFIGLIGGTIPSIVKKIKLNHKMNLTYILISMMVVYLINIGKSSTIFNPTLNIVDMLYVLLIGFLDALTMIIPGISGTATFMMLGCYDFVLKIFSNPFGNILFTILFFLGVIIGIIIISKLIAYLLEKFPQQLYLLVIGFSLSSLFYLFLKIFKLIKFTNFIPCLLLLIIGFLISYKLDNL